MEHLEQKQKVTIMVAVMAAMFFAAVNMTIVGTALPKIVSKIGGMEYFDWVFTVYMLTSTVTAMLVGKLSDIYGRKIFILIGIGIFMVGAFLSGTSNTIYDLIIFRGIQGFGGGMIMSTAFTTVGDLFTPRERGRWQGLLGAMFGLSSLFGPTFGGYIVDNYAWHWIFWIFLPIGFIAFALIMKLYPKHDKVKKEPVDYFGSLFLTLMIVTLLLGFSWAGNQYDWLSFQILSLFAVSIFSLLIFIKIERKVASPVLPLYLFKNSVFTLSNVASFLTGMGMFGVIMYTPFYVQGVLGKSATTSGLIEMVMTVSMVAASTIAGQWITKTGKYKSIAIIGLAIMAAGLLANSSLTVDSSLRRLVLQLIVVGIGLGTTMPVFQVSIQNAVSHKYLGVATSAMQVFRQMGGTIGVAIMGSLMGQLMTRRMEELKQTSLSSPPAGMGEQMQALQSPQVLMDADLLAKIHANIPEQMMSFFNEFIGILRNSLNDSLTGVFMFSGSVVVLAVIVSFFMKEIPLRTTNEDDDERQPVKVTQTKQGYQS